MEDALSECMLSMFSILVDGSMGVVSCTGVDSAVLYMHWKEEFCCVFLGWYENVFLTNLLCPHLVFTLVGY